MTTEENIKKRLTEGAEYLGMLKFISEGIKRKYLELDYIEKIINQRLLKWDKKPERKEQDGKENKKEV